MYVCFLRTRKQTFAIISFGSDSQRAHLGATLIQMINSQFDSGCCEDFSFCLFRLVNTEKKSVSREERTRKSH